MKYDKGSFITVPSREKLSGLPPTAQTLYMWLCSYANETGNCFPSRKTLAGHVGCSESMIDKMLGILEETKLLKKKGRKEGDRQLSNLYTVLIVPPLPHSGTPPTTEYAPPSHDVRTNSTYVTQSIEGAENGIYESLEIEEENPKPSKVIPTPYSIESTRTAWKSGERRLQVLEWYLTEANLWPKATNKDKLKAIMARHSNAANRIARADWSPRELKQAKSQIINNESLQGEWTLETVEKYLTK